MSRGTKFTGKEFTREECFEILKRYDKPCYEYYMNNAWYFGYNARNYAQHLYLINLVKEMFDKYNLIFVSYAPSSYKVFGNDGSYSIVSIREHQLVIDGRCMDEEDFEKWCFK